MGDREAWPHDEQSELNCIGVAMLYPDKAVQSGLTSADFYDGLRAKVWAAILSLAEDGATGLTEDNVAAELGRRGIMPEDEALQMLLDWGLGGCDVPSFDRCVAKIKECAEQRCYLALASDIARLAHKGGKDWLKAVEERIAKARSETPRQVRLYSPGELRELTSGVEWLWPGWIPKRAVTTLVSKSGVGKTLLTCALAAALDSGGRWPDQTQAPKGKVLYLDAEAGAGELLEKMVSVGVRSDSENVRVLYGDTGGFVACDDRWDDVEAAWREWQPDLVVVDPLTAHHRRDANSAREMRSFFARLYSLAQETGAAVLVLHHIRKRGLLDSDKVDLDRVRDSSDIVAASRSVLALEPEEKDGDTLRLTCLKSNFVSRPEALRYVIGEDGLLYLGVAEERETLSQTAEAERWLKDTLRDGPRPAREVQALAAEAGIAMKTLRRAKKKAGVKSIQTPEGWLWQSDSVSELKNVGHVTMWPSGSSDHLGGSDGQVAKMANIRMDDVGHLSSDLDCFL